MSSSTSMKPSFCKCCYPDSGKPDNDSTYNCCFQQNFSCSHVEWSNTHQRVCHIPVIILSIKNSLTYISVWLPWQNAVYNNRAKLAQCCGPDEPNIGYNCQIGWKLKVLHICSNMSNSDRWSDNSMHGLMQKWWTSRDSSDFWVILALSHCLRCFWGI